MTHRESTKRIPARPERVRLSHGGSRRFKSCSAHHYLFRINKFQRNLTPQNISFGRHTEKRLCECGGGVSFVQVGGPIDPQYSQFAIWCNEGYPIGNPGSELEIGVYPNNKSFRTLARQLGYPLWGNVRLRPPHNQNQGLGPGRSWKRDLGCCRQLRFSLRGCLLPGRYRV